MSNIAYFLKITNHLAGMLDIKSALIAVKSEIGNIIEFDHLDVCLIDDDNMCNVSYEVGLATEWSATKFLINISPVRDILTGKTDVLFTGNAMNDERYTFAGAASQPIFKHQLRSRINVAMKVLGRTVGSLNCSSKKADFYSEVNIAQVKALADILAPYFFALRANEKAARETIFRAEVQAREEGLRLGALSLTDTLEAERQRIGMDLHDQTLADLTRISRDLKPTMTRAQLLEMQDRVRETIQGLRSIIDTSIPSILELFGFQHAIQTHFERAVGVHCSITFNFADDSAAEIDNIPETTRVALFRICQEAINNSVQHSGATQIGMRIHKSENGDLMISINDNGSFRQPGKHTAGGMTHMRTRARLIGASFRIENANGTHIFLTLPVA